jgi:thiol-disulfide isomerase/thioredoxin
MKHLLAILVVAALTVAAVPASAGVKVGDKPKLQFKATDGTDVSLDKLRGKIVLVDFWATWCPPCMALADEMVALNKEFGPRGMQVIGVSLDQDRARLDKVVKEKGFTWPQYFDGKGWENDLWLKWGEESVPFTVILSPQGEVIWKGTPGPELKGVIEKAFKEHPPAARETRSPKVRMTNQ